MPRHKTEMGSFIAVVTFLILWCPRRDSNPEPTDYESAALTVELQGHNNLRAVGFRL